MGIRWGASSGYLSFGIDLSYSGDPNSAFVTLTAIYYIRADGYGHNFSSTLRLSGEQTGTKTYSFYSPTGGSTVKEVHRVSWRKSTAYGAPVTVTVGATTDTIWNGGKPSSSASVQIPARAFQGPATPTNISARRISDTQVTVTWAQSVSSAAPVHLFGIERKSESDPVWRRVGTVNSSNARSWTDSSVSANERYTYQVFASNGKVSGKIVSNSVSMTPAAPGAVNAVKTSGGDIEVSWESNAGYPIESWTVFDNGIQIGVVSSSEPRWMHRSPSTSQTHVYRVRADAGDLHSQLSPESNRVQLLAPPNSPIPQTSHEVYPPGTHSLRWTHAPVDSSVQTSAKVRYRAVGGSSWIERTVNGSSDTFNVPLSVGTYEWQVQTWGAYKPGHSSGASPWSALATVSFSDRPTLSISTPGTRVSAAFLNVEWGYYQPQGIAQSVVEFNLFGGNGLAVLESQEVQGTANSLSLKTRLENGANYVLAARSRSALGLWSEWERVYFTVAFPLPPQPRVLVEWVESEGRANITVVNPEPAAHQHPAVGNRVYRSVDGGYSWELVAENIPVGGSLGDPECLSCGETRYKAVALTAQDAASDSVIESLTASSQSLWLSSGQGFPIAIPLKFNPITATRTGLVNRKVHHFAGRSLGVEMSGIQREKIINISAVLFDDEWNKIEQLQALALAPAPLLYRDPLGRRIYCSIGAVDLSRALTGLWTVKTQIEEVDRE